MVGGVYGDNFEVLKFIYKLIGFVIVNSPSMAIHLLNTQDI